MSSTRTPCGCGGSSRGGGTAGPSGDVDSDRAGDDGEYHHSRNLIKNIAVGRSTFSESSSSRGDLLSAYFRTAMIPLGRGLGDLRTPACAARYMQGVSAIVPHSICAALPYRLRLCVAGQRPPMTAMGGSAESVRTGMQRCRAAARFRRTCSATGTPLCMLSSSAPSTTARRQ